MPSAHGYSACNPEHLIFLPRSMILLACQIPRPTASSTAERFLTRTSIGALQPPAASNYIAIDDGNASPRLMRLTLNQISTLNDATKACAIPIAAICQPLAEPAPGEAPIPVRKPC